MNIKLDIPENFYRGEERCGYYVSPEKKKFFAVLLDLLAEFGNIITISRLFNDSTTFLFSRDPQHLEFLRKMNMRSGIFLDIFPVDDVPDSEKNFMKFYNRIKRLNYIANKLKWFTDWYFPAKKLWRRPIKASIHYITKMMNLSCRSCHQEILNMLELTSYPNSKYVAKSAMIIFDEKFLSRRIWDRSAFDDLVYLPFEMLNLPAPLCYEHILDKFYGNWHEYVITPWKTEIFFDTEHSYTYYTKEGHSIDDGAI